MHGRSGIRALVASLIVAGSVVACDATGITMIDEGQGMPQERMPLWASFDLRGDPEVTTRELRLAVDVLPDSPGLRSISFPADTIVRWSEGLSDGPIRLVSTAPDCSWELVLPPERSTSIVFHHDADPCWFELAEAPPPDDAASLSATVTVQPWAGLVVEAVSLDEPRQPVPAAVPPDEGGLAQLSPLYPGRYEILLRRGDTILERRIIDINPTGPQDRLIQLTLDGVPD
jgi:hypothetical protein